MENYFNINNIFIEIFNYKLSYLEFWAVITGLIAVYLSSRENAWSWIIGLINVILFFILFYQIQLYPDMLLQVFYFITNCIGFIFWKFPKKEDENKLKELKITRTKISHIYIYIGVTCIATLFLGSFASHLHQLFPMIFSLPSAYPYIDSLTTILSIVATFLLMKKKLEAWIIWLIVDIIATIIYALKNVQFVAIEYFIFCIIAIYGTIKWMKEYQRYVRIS